MRLARGTTPERPAARQQHTGAPGRRRRHEHNRADLAAEGPGGQGQDGHLQVPDISEHMSFLEMLDVLNERLTLRRRRPDRLRPRLPRGHLRHVRGGDQRRGARPAADDHLPAAHALVLRRRRDRHRAVAGGRVPGRQGPGGRPRRLRPDHPGRRLHLRPDRHRARGARHAGAQDATPTTRSTRRPASAAGPAWRPARTGRRCCSPPPR